MQQEAAKGEAESKTQRTLAGTLSIFIAATGVPGATITTHPSWDGWRRREGGAEGDGEEEGLEVIREERDADKGEGDEKDDEGGSGGCGGGPETLMHPTSHSLPSSSTLCARFVL